MSIHTVESKSLVKPAEEVLPLVLQEKEIIFADLETTGFGQYDDITEIGAVRVNVETGKVISRFSTLVHLRLHAKVPPKITEVTNITTEMLAGAPPPEVVLNCFYQFIGGSVLSFHNASFDWRMLQNKYACIGKTLTNEVICSMKLFKYLHPGVPSGLASVCSFYGKPIVGHHRAVVDCTWSAACYCKMRQELLDMQEGGQIFLPQTPLPRQTVHEMTWEDLQRECRIFRISGWKKGKRRRIYVSTTVADVFYDLEARAWNVSQRKKDCNLNLDVLIRYILAATELNQPDFVEKYQPVA